MFSVPVSDRTCDWVLRRWRRSTDDRLYVETPVGARLGNHASRPQTGKHAWQEGAVAPDLPAAAYRARHAVLDWVDLSPT